MFHFPTLTPDTSQGAADGIAASCSQVNNNTPALMGLNVNINS